MNPFTLSLVCFILGMFRTSFGLLGDTHFSICWMSKNEALERQSGNIWLNETALKSIRRVGRVNSVTVQPGVENTLALKYGSPILKWTFTIFPSQRLNKIKGLPKPLRSPTNASRSFLDSLNSTDVFACENGTVFFYQDDDFFLAAGHSLRLPVELESRSASMLLLSWAVVAAPGGSHVVTLYRRDADSYTALGIDSTELDHYHFVALDACSVYLVCVERAGSQAAVCRSAVTDPDVPKDFALARWNASSLSLTWNCPDNQRFSQFLLTTFHLNATDGVAQAKRLWLGEERLAFTLSDLPPCSRVRFGLQTVCRSGAESSYSDMILNDGNSAHSRIRALRQTSFGPDNYTLSWELGHNSSVHNFRVYHDEVPRGTTLLTHYTVDGLEPCRRYGARVEALCGAGVVMSVQSVTAHTGPRGVSDLRYRANDSTVVWTPSNSSSSSSSGQVMSYMYRLSLQNGTVVQSSRVNDAQLRLPGLDRHQAYVLDVWEEFDGEWESEPAQLCFQGSNSSLGFLFRSGLAKDMEFDFDMSSFGLSLTVPWSLPDLQDEPSEARSKIEKIFIDKMQELLTGFDPPVRVELAAMGPADDQNQTEVLFLSFDASGSDKEVMLDVGDQLDYIMALDPSNISAADGVLRWDGPDLCGSFRFNVCPRNSVCVNTLGSFTCLCRPGHYDVRPVIESRVTAKPICNEKGLFSQCLERRMLGGIAKPYLTSHVGGKVEVRLNDARCRVEQSNTFYFFRTSRKSSECGTERRVNRTHIEYQNTLFVALTKEEKISRRDLKVVWRCVYPRHYVRHAQVGMDMEWLSTHSVVEFNSSLQLSLAMTLYRDASFTDNYTDVVSLEIEDILYLQVALQTNNTFASDVLLQVDSCWATESADPLDQVRGVLLKDSCPADHTLHWLSVNGREQRSRFSVQMFAMPKGLPIYIHCLTNICAHDQDCTKNCSSETRSRRSVTRSRRAVTRSRRSVTQADGTKKKPAAVVSAGPVLIFARTKSGERPSHWTDHMTMISVVAGSVGLLGLTLLSVAAIKAIMNYYQRQQLHQGF